ncbi:DUF1788 domain-containing protein [Synechococcus sp. CS-602]|uniref:DUF1788 domain-containing protein n=1 Tax=Synechococcaceae TaxID=1890426 RepID=UPI0008FF75D1|nr:MULTISPECIES: DUF1788 domain-containing protein [Synechococcaceae]MCT4365673.1 DUF1788 domain-containing protein [Candidatus Regnicoccus frigidus MAG-AL1]APD47094.1 hypothetical protein BM449_00575 [Synechococcus sp. SynAce01]MCT0200926.1 DUF1788 domain-containing protein [Synechococcus sp. CS-603]MCT0203809.1 DUF1788 domain-containing protein [Synechococcus sp. CS-602]MCT0246337.1 DUF1788 domain-containing protein [Synechococcus sp. CS-601]
MSTKTTTGLDQRLKQVLSQPSFLAMKGLAKEIPIFIQTYDPSEEDELRQIVKGLLQGLKQEGLRVIHLDLLELVIQILEEKGFLEDLLRDETTYSKSDVFETLQSTSDPTKALVPKLMEVIGANPQLTLITGSGRIYPFLRTHTIIEALQPEMVRHPVVIFFPGEYSQDADGGSYLRLFGTTPNTKIENPHYRATNLAYFDTPIS